MTIPQDKFQTALKKVLKDLDFRPDELEACHQWDNVEFGVVITVWKDRTVDICGISNISVQEVLGPLMDQLNEGEN